MIDPRELETKIRKELPDGYVVQVDTVDNILDDTEEIVRVFIQPTPLYSTFKIKKDQPVDLNTIASLRTVPHVKHHIIRQLSPEYFNGVPVIMEGLYDIAYNDRKTEDE